MPAQPVDAASRNLTGLHWSSFASLYFAWVIDVNHFCRLTTTILTAVVSSPIFWHEGAFTGGVHHFRLFLLLPRCLRGVDRAGSRWELPGTRNGSVL